MAKWTYSVPNAAPTCTAEQAAKKAGMIDDIRARMAAKMAAAEQAREQAAKEAAEKQKKEADARRAAHKAEQAAKKAAKKSSAKPTEQAAKKSSADFDALKLAWTTSPDDGAALETLSTAIASAVVKKCADPMRKIAVYMDGVSDGGASPVMRKLRRDIQHDAALLRNTRTMAEGVYKMETNAHGEREQVVADEARKNALDALTAQTLGDGCDLFQTAALELLEERAAHNDGSPEWLDRTYKAHRLDKHVIIRREDGAAWKEVDTSPVREAFRAVRGAVENTAAVREASGKYAYIDAMDGDDGDGARVYRRLPLYSDLGGAAYNGGAVREAGAPPEYDGGNSLYTVGAEEVSGYYAMRDRLALTARQEVVLTLRERGYGHKAVATYLGVKPETVYATVKRIRAAATAAGITPREK